MYITQGERIINSSLPSPSLPSSRVATTSVEPVCLRAATAIEQGFTIDGHLNGLDAEEDYVDKCIWVEGQDAPTDLPIAGTTVKSSLIGFHVSDMYIHNCGYVGLVADVEYSQGLPYIRRCRPQVDTICSCRKAAHIHDYVNIR